MASQPPGPMPLDGGIKAPILVAPPVQPPIQAVPRDCISCVRRKGIREPDARGIAGSTGGPSVSANV